MYQELGSSNFALASSRHVCPTVQRRSLLPCIYEERYLASHVPDTHINLECNEIIDWDNLDSCDMYTAPDSSEKLPMEKSTVPSCDGMCQQNSDNDDNVNMYDKEDFPPPNSPINGICMEEKPVLYLQNRYVTSLLQLWRDSAVENSTAGNELFDGSSHVNNGSSCIDDSVNVTDAAGCCDISESSSVCQSQDTKSPSSSQSNEMMLESSECSDMSSASESCSLKSSVTPSSSQDNDMSENSECSEMSSTRERWNMNSLVTEAELQAGHEQDPTPSPSYQMTESLSSCPSAGTIGSETMQLYQASNALSNSNGHLSGRSSPELFHQEFFPFGRSSPRAQSPSMLELMSHFGSRYEQFRSLSPTIVRSPSPLSSRSSSPRFFRTPSPLDEIQHGLSGLPLDDELVFYNDRYVTRSFSPPHSSDREVPDIDMEFQQTVEDSDEFPSSSTYYRQRTLNSCQDQVVPGSIEE